MNEKEYKPVKRVVLLILVQKTREKNRKHVNAETSSVSSKMLISSQIC